MATLHVRGISDELHEKIMALAEDSNRSFGAQIALLLDLGLAQHVLASGQGVVLRRIAERRRRRSAVKHRSLSTTDMLRADRER